MKAAVIGSGGWGTALAMRLQANGIETFLWSHNLKKAAEMAETRQNPMLSGVTLPENLTITADRV